MITRLDDFNNAPGSVRFGKERRIQTVEKESQDLKQCLMDNCIDFSDDIGTATSDRLDCFKRIRQQIRESDQELEFLRKECELLKQSALQDVEEEFYDCETSS